MNRTEVRLRDLFAAIDEQLEVAAVSGVADQRRRNRRPAGRLLAVAVAAAVLAVVGGVAVWRSVSDEPGTVVLDATITPSEFDSEAGDVCLALDRARNGVTPRFETSEAYLVVVDQRRRAIDAAIASLLAIPEPDDDGALPAAAVNRLREVEPLLAAVEEAAASGLLDDAATAWAAVDPAIDSALEALGRGRSGPCAREEG